MTTPQSSQSPGGLGEREMLEAAAKAAGIEIVRSRLDDPMHRDMLIVNSPRNVGQKTGPWNPLVDDGDALRLAVDLGICIEFTSCADDAPVVYCGPDYQRRDWPMTPNFPDPFKETRRAIVRAAAAMASERGRG